MPTSPIDYGRQSSVKSAAELPSHALEHENQIQTTKATLDKFVLDLNLMVHCALTRTNMKERLTDYNKHAKYDNLSHPKQKR
jgi:hypothetical protein